ncbi:MAG: ABC transporter permease subunit [Polyangiaceae bacterium]|nr:ABC transporter permease subunit [Polyangiaceae bacterium]
MLHRIGAITLNTYREAVRARILHGLFALALATGGYSLVVGAYALRDSLRVVSDLGAASISIYGILVAIILGATSLYRELELKTIFPILARPISRTEYLLGKFLGTVLTMATFVAANTAVLLLALGALTDQSLSLIAGVGALSLALAGGAALLLPRRRTYIPIFWAFCLLLVGWFMAAGAPDDRRVLLGSAVLTVLEVCIVSAVATVFAAFSSPFLSAVFTLGVFIVGRSADTLAHLPARVFGEAIHDAGEALSRVVPNLMFYVPPRTLLTGESSGVELLPYIGSAALQALGWSLFLLALAAGIFRRRDFL